MANNFKTGSIQIGDFSIPEVSTNLNIKDYIGSVMVRWGINRNNYKVDPGIYAVGKPDSSSDVFVTANYKLSFDNLRKNLTDTNGLILVLDTKGINVWCAAGKGTFGTKELVNRIKTVSLERIVNHRKVILPQLGANGVSAHKVKEETGFNANYGPVRAADIKRFITNGYRADREMRRVKFEFGDRVKLIPNDFIYGKYYLLGAMAVVFLISCLTREGFSFRNISGNAVPALINIFSAYLSGIVITPMLLPYIPARAFSLKGFYSGILIFIALLVSGRTGNNIFEQGSWFLIIGAISSFTAMNFTGSSTFTSLSGVKKEMKFSLPLQIGSAVVGIILLVVGKLI
jgi:hypothetical protein